MRKTPFAIFLSLVYLNLCGQSDLPFPDHDAKWVWEDFHADKEYFTKHAYTYTLENDTMINDVIYHNVGLTMIWSYVCYDQYGGYIYCEDPPLVENDDSYKGLTGAIREEGKKIFYYQYPGTYRPLYGIPDTTEVLLYDFDITLGDTIRGMWDSADVVRVVTDTASEMLNDGLWHKRYWIHGGLDYWGGGQYWYEGMGSDNGLLGPYEPICEWCGLFLNCFWQEGDYVYGSDSCELEMVPITETVPDLEPVKITPNPFHDELVVSVPGEGKSYTLQLHDMFGRILLEQDINFGATTINTMSVDPGFYFLSIKFNNELIETQRIVKL